MATVLPPPPGVLAPTYWQLPPAPANPEILPGLRRRMVGLVAAMAVQATIALLGVLPAMPVGAGGPAFQPVNFWAQFAVIELIAAAIVSLAFGPGVRVGDVPLLGRAVLALAFVVVPAVAIGIASFDVADAAALHGAGAVTSRWLNVAFFTTAFFGLPVLALAGRRRPVVDERPAAASA